MEKELTTDVIVFTILTNDLRLASYLELQTVYDVADAYDLVEVIDAHQTIIEPSPVK